ASGGIVFTTIQKFMPIEEDIIEPQNIVQDPGVKYIGAEIKSLSNRKNIVVIADEARRSQYDFIDGFARHLRDSLPYESRLAKVHFEEEEKVKLDEEFEELTEGEELSQQRQLRARWTRLEAIVGNPGRIARIAEDLVFHFEQRSSVSEGKAMIVCMRRRICVDMYNAIINLRPQWHSEEDDEGTIKVVMTGSSADILKLQPHIRNKARRKAIGERLKNPQDSLKIVIVRDM